MSEHDAPETIEPEDRSVEIEHKLVELLARREHSRLELRRKLEQRGYGFDEVEPVLADLTAQGLQSDARFAEHYARDREQRGYGPVRIRMELRERGVDETLIETALAELGVDWFAAARAARHKRFGSGVPDEFRDRARQLRFLQNRGFDAEQCRAALEDDPEDR
ncbi:regulatory protein RecX [Thiohalobacter thiocyanaticus]|uniref:Regulatory protein RecX n=1 Tax=Thiohalobacter thiocyanaticus TaxID=585455 RepID=A0A426QLU8_9GAMM|nr:regulatory protein RecX [Thiohalobacter thiocyanaticus]RRQ22719.1 regulatory protein RecX [Thiohalobacter thiocyanaticus]